MKTSPLLLLMLVTLLAGEAAARGRGGGSRSGGSRYSSSRSSRSTSRYTSARSSETYSYPSRSGTRLSSTYVRYIPSVRYSRVYVGFTGPYIYYYSLYFGYAGSPAYLGRQRPSGDVDVCVNYEANDNGTAMGVFTCPVHPSEPREYTNCCGEQYAEYCCKKESKENTTVIVIICVIIAVVLICAVVVIVICCKRKSTTATITTTTTTATTRYTAHESDEPNDTASARVRYEVKQPTAPGEFPPQGPPGGYGSSLDPGPSSMTQPPSYYTATASNPPHEGTLPYQPGGEPNNSPFPPNGYHNPPPYPPDGDPQQTPYPPGGGLDKTLSPPGGEPDKTSYPPVGVPLQP